MPKARVDPLQSLASQFPPDRFLTSPAETSLYASDGAGLLAQPPAAVVLPESIEEVVRTVRYCHEQGIPYVPRGNGTGISGGACPSSPRSLVLAFPRMNEILHIDPLEPAALVQPGVRLEILQQETAPHGLRWLPRPRTSRCSSAGGVVARNAAGPDAFRSGTPCTHLKGATVVLPGGSVAEWGSNHAAPADPLALLPGSGGTWGILVELSLRLVPACERTHGIFAGFETWNQALEAADAFLYSGLTPAVLEAFDEASGMALSRELPSPGSPGAYLDCVLEGRAEEVEAERRRALDLLRRFRAEPIRETADPDALEAGTRSREELSSSRADLLVEEAVVPRSRMAELSQELRKLVTEEARSYHLTVDAVTGTLRPAFRFEPANESDFRAAERCALRFLFLAANLGGVVAGQEGIGRRKRSLQAALSSPDQLRFLQDWHGRWDPDRLCNADKVLPAAPPEIISLFPLRESALSPE